MSEVFRPSPETIALDEHLYDRFAEVAAFQAYEYLGGSSAYRKEQKRKFIAGEIDNPQLDYPQLDLERLNQIENNLLAQKADLLAQEPNETLKQVYRWRINEKIAEARLLKATMNGDMGRFKRYSEFIYGSPSREIFEYSVNTVRKSAQEARMSGNDDLRKSAEKLLKVLPDINIDTPHALPEPEQVEVAHNQVIQEFGDMINIPIEGEKIDAEGIKFAFDQAIRLLGDNEWKVVIDPDASNISSNQEKEKLTVPEDRKVTQEKLRDLIIHEVGTHIARRINGKRSNLKLLSLGLDRYEVGEEGVTTLREQALLNEVEDFAGLPRHLSVSLALGLDGRPRDFREVYEIMERYFEFEHLKEGDDPAEASSEASSEAWARTVRTFRGTDCKTPGVCFTKDIIYREGNIGVWDVVKEHPEEMMRFSVGKYDPSNPRHITVLEQLGITDQDLQTLEN